MPCAQVAGGSHPLLHDAEATTLLQGMDRTGANAWCVITVSIKDKGFLGAALVKCPANSAFLFM